LNTGALGIPESSRQIPHNLLRIAWIRLRMGYPRAILSSARRVVPMPREKLTKRVVDGLKPPEPSKVGVKVRETLAWDRELRGFGVQVMPSGLKSFVIQYRNAEGRTRRTVLGRYGLMTVEEARKIAHEKLVAVSKGIDPAAGPSRDAEALTVADICDWYLREAEVGRILGKRRRPIKASTLAMDRSRIERHRARQNREATQRKPRRVGLRRRGRRLAHSLHPAQPSRARDAAR